MPIEKSVTRCECGFEGHVTEFEAKNVRNEGSVTAWGHLNYSRVAEMQCPECGQISETRL